MKRLVLLIIAVLSIYNSGHAQKAEGVMKNAAMAYINGQVIVYPYKADSVEKNLKGVVYSDDFETSKEFEIPANNFYSARLQKQNNGHTLKLAMNSVFEDYTLVHYDSRFSGYYTEKVNLYNMGENREKYKDTRKYMYPGLEVQGGKDTRWIVDVLTAEKNYKYNMYASIAGAGAYNAPPAIVGGHADKATPGLYNKEWSLPVPAVKNLKYKIVQGGIDTVGVLLYSSYGGKSLCSLMIVKVSSGELVLAKQLITPETPSCTFSEMVYSRGNFYIAGVYGYAEGEKQLGAQGLYLIKAGINGIIQEAKEPLANNQKEGIIPANYLGKALVIHRLTVVSGEVAIIGENIAYIGSAPVSGSYSLSNTYSKAPVVSDAALSYGFTFMKFNETLKPVYHVFAPLADGEVVNEDKLTAPCRCTDVVSCSALVPGLSDGALGLVTDGVAKNVVYTFGGKYYRLNYDGKSFKYIPVKQQETGKSQHFSIQPGAGEYYYTLVTDEKGYSINRVMFDN